eukprot:TRINITY_DN1216_c0_g1_i1.p1 TRINITY_DN1216_c0_g1~~TRINITY_DN1216_c0_g1_i1.p1  ORF type:complete len:190 (-),score=92.28 TRINITY_DN1216_c0_g1_i1:9-578(-)
MHARNIQRMVRGHMARRNLERAGGLSLRNIDDIVAKANQRAAEAKKKAGNTTFKKSKDISLDINNAEMFRDPKMAERQQQKKLDQLQERKKKKEEEEKERKRQEQEEKEAEERLAKKGKKGRKASTSRRPSIVEEKGLFSNKQMDLVKRQRRDSIAGGAANRRCASTITRGSGNTLLGALSEEKSPKGK